VAINIEEPGRLVDFVASSLPFLSTKDKQEILETPDVSRRLQAINHHLAKELEFSSCATRSRMKCRIRCSSRNAILFARTDEGPSQKELGEQDETQRDVDELRQKIEAAGMPEEGKKGSHQGTNRLARMSPMAATIQSRATTLEWLAVLPWAKSSGVCGGHQESC